MLGRFPAPWFLACVLGGIPSPIAAQSIHYVDADATGAATGASWTDAFTDLRAGLAAANPGDEVWVAEGTYKPDGGTLDKQLSFELREGTVVYGGFEGNEVILAQRDPEQHVVVLSGDLSGNDEPGRPKWKDNSRHVVRVLPAPPAPPATIDGVTVIGGSATGLAQSGGGLTAIDASVTLRRCKFVDNRATHSGGGAHVQGAGTLIVEECVFEHCMGTSSGAGGLFSTGVASSRVSDCQFLGNFLGGLVLSGTEATIERCVFAGNDASIQSGAGLGVSTPGGTTTIQDCLIVGNALAAFSGAGLGVDGGDVSILRCTISGNTCGPLGAGAGIAISDITGPTAVSIRDSIIWGNETTDPVDPYSAQIMSFGASSLVITFSIVEGWQASWPGHGTIDADPGFVDPAGPDLILGTADDDWSLLAGSPAIDSANPTTQAASFDLLGNPRTLDGELDGVAFVDRGALELTPARLLAEPANVSPGGSAQLSVTGIAGLPAFLLIGLGGPATLVDPYGVAGVDLALPWIIVPWGPVPATSQIHVPSSFVSGWDLALQAVVVDVNTQAAALTNVVTLEID